MSLRLKKCVLKWTFSCILSKFSIFYVTFVYKLRISSGLHVVKKNILKGTVSESQSENHLKSQYSNTEFDYPDSCLLSVLLHCRTNPKDIRIADSDWMCIHFGSSLFFPKMICILYLK